MTTMGPTYAYYPSVDGTYYFFVIDKNGCISDTAFYLLDRNNTLEHSQGADLYIHPNPAHHYIYVSSAGEKKIFNTLGEFLFSSREQKINIAHLPVEIYYLKTEGFRFVKFIKR